METLTPPPDGPRHTAVIPAVESLELARRLHRSLLPSRLTNEKADVAACCREIAQLGGDYCTAYWQSPQRLFLCVCDVTGHGIASALLAARINTFVRLEIEHALHPCEVINRLNRFLSSNFKGLGIYATFFCAALDWAGSTLQFAGAGHPPALRRRADGSIQCLQSASPLLGIIDEFPTACQVACVPFHPGDAILLYTDGLIEAADPAGQFYDLQRVMASLSRLPDPSDAGFALDHLFAELDAFSGAAGVKDDVLILYAINRAR